MPAPKQPYYRPYLTREELALVEQALCGRQVLENKELQELRKKISLLIFKADNDMLVPAHVGTPKESLEESLGISTEDARYLNGEMSAEESAAYEIALMNHAMNAKKGG